MGYDITIGDACFHGSKEDAYMTVWAKPGLGCQKLRMAGDR